MAEGLACITSLKVLGGKILLARVDGMGLPGPHHGLAWCLSLEAKETEPKSVTGFRGLESM